jgi:hypothetical protein
MSVLHFLAECGIPPSVIDRPAFKEMMIDENSEFVEFVDEIMSEYQPALTDDDEDEDCEFED